MNCSKKLDRKGFRKVALAAGAALLVAASCGPEGGENSDPGQDPTEPHVREAGFGLLPAADCDQVNDHLVEVLTENFLDEYYNGYGGLDFASGESSDDVGSDSGGDGGRSDSPSEYTDTNVQEVGVDEPDIIKTDGDYIYAVLDGSLQILSSWPPEDTHRVGRFEFPSGARPSAILLDGDMLATFSRIWQGGWRFNDETEEWIEPDPSERFSGTRISLFDISDRTNPQPIRQLDVEGHQVDARMIDGRVYLVTNSWIRDLSIWQYFNQIDGIPAQDWEDDSDAREAKKDLARPLVAAHIAADLADRSPSEWMPRQRIVDSAGEVVLAGAMYECTDLYLPEVAARAGMLNISYFTMDDKTSIQSTGLLAQGWQLYASRDNLYIAMSSRSWWWWGWGNMVNESHIHKFGLPVDEAPQYKASGRVDGWILNQFSFSEYDGYLRVATTDNRWGHNPDTGEFEDEGGNHVIILEQDGSELVEVGSVRDLAPTERIYSARFMGDKGYIVTFRDTDPFYTLDLSDPTNPQMLGELKIEGFSSYMHPLDENHLLAIGRDGDENGFMTGVHLQVFDVSDMSNPTRIHHHVISTGGWSSYSEAMWNHRAFTYQARLGVLAIPMSIWEQGDRFSGLMLFDATKDGITEMGRVDHTDLVAQDRCLRQGQDVDCTLGDSQNYSWWSNMRRSVIMSDFNTGEEFVYSLSSVGMKVSDLYDTDQELSAVLFRAD